MSKKRRKEVAQLKIRSEKLVRWCAYKLNLIVQNGPASFESQSVAPRSSDELMRLLHEKERQLVWINGEFGPLAAEAKKVAAQVGTVYYLLLCIFFETDKKIRGFKYCSS